MNEVNKSDQLFTKVTRGRPLIDQHAPALQRIAEEPPTLDYSEDEMNA